MIAPLVTFQGQRLEVRYSSYDNGRTALLLYTKRGELWAKATANLPDHPLGEDEAFLRDYSEKTGMLTALIDAGVVENTGRSVQSGFVRLPVVRIL